MFGYVMPCKMELKVKDYEKFKAYYCGLCHSIKNNYGNIPRLALNYDMTFLGLLLDSFEDVPVNLKKFKCAIHPGQKKMLVSDSDTMDYAARCNIILTYYKLIDNINDDKELKSRIASLFLKKYIKEESFSQYIKTSLTKLDKMEQQLQQQAEEFNIDQICDPFADLTGFIISNYSRNPMDLREPLYWLGYNLGKWIYLIDAWDDLEKDIQQKKFNVINELYNKTNKGYSEFAKEIQDTVEYSLTSCAATCNEIFENLPIKKNIDLLTNILQLGLMEKMDTVFKRSEEKNA